MYDIIRCARAEVYHNTRMLTQEQIMQEKGCTHILNGYYFNNDPDSEDYFEPLGWLVIDGNVLSVDKWRDWGFFCDKSGAPVMSTDRTKSFLGSLPLLKDGKRCERELTPDIKPPAARTAVAWLEDGRVLLWCSKEKLTIDELVERLLELGAVDAIAMDGGGSSQGRFPDGVVESSRLVPTHLLLWALDDDNKEKDDANMNGESVKVYSKSKDGNEKLSANFKVKEFACKDGSDPVFVSPELVTILQKIRTHFGKAVTINSAYRTPTHNAREGGEAYSQHLYGMAADIVVKGIAPKTVAAYAEKLMPNSGGIGIYGTFTHIDVRSNKSRWNG